ncbi:MAG: DnaD domain protein [bacterium]|nr:DnaD domain protein [bacterium]
MSTISLRTNHNNDVTIISNIFIDSYMPTANGAYVKVYLYLLRCLSSNTFDLSISTIADQLEDTEKDIMRAIAYWEKVNLILVTRDENNQITNITFNNPTTPLTENYPPYATNIEENKAAIHPDTVSQTTSAKESPMSNDVIIKPTYTKAQIELLSKDDNVQLLLAAVESYMARPLKSADQQLILYLYENIGFSSDLILFLFEYCISINKKSASYVEAVALGWAKEGIDSEEKAKQYTNKYNKTYQAINKAFGLNRTPGEIEIKFINKWVNHLNLPLELIIEACNRTLLRTGKPDFNYADKIITSWAQHNVKSLADVTKLDENHAKQAKPAYNAQKQTTAKPNANNKFNNFAQRNYSKEDFRKMEQLLLNKQ